jgi:hypothetical protein
VGSEAYNREMTQLDRRLTDARQQAELGAGQAQAQALDSRRQMIKRRSCSARRRSTKSPACAAARNSIRCNSLGSAAQQVGAAPIFGATAAEGQHQLDQYKADLNYALGQKQLATGGITRIAMGGG